MDATANVIAAANLTIIYSPTDVLLNVSLAFILGLLVSFIYKITHKGLSYSQSFMLTQIFIAVIVAIVIMVIGNSLARAFALVGALSIIRFRTVVKDTKDMAFIFMALAAGLAAGTSSYFLAVAGTLFFAVIAIVLSVANYGSLYKSEFILRFRAPTTTGEPLYAKVMDEMTKSANLLHVEPAGDRASTKLTFDVILAKNIDPKEFSVRMAGLEGISEVVLVASKSDVDY